MAVGQPAIPGCSRAVLQDDVPSHRGDLLRAVAEVELVIDPALGIFVGVMEDGQGEIQPFFQEAQYRVVCLVVVRSFRDYPQVGIDMCPPPLRPGIGKTKTFLVGEFGRLLRADFVRNCQPFGEGVHVVGGSIGAIGKGRDRGDGGGEVGHVIP